MQFFVNPNVKVSFMEQDQVFFIRVGNDNQNLNHLALSKNTFSYQQCQIKRSYMYAPPVAMSRQACNSDHSLFSLHNTLYISTQARVFMHKEQLVSSHLPPLTPVSVLFDRSQGAC